MGFIFTHQYATCLSFWYMYDLISVTQCCIMSQYLQALGEGDTQSVKGLDDVCLEVWIVLQVVPLHWLILQMKHPRGSCAAAYNDRTSLTTAVAFNVTIYHQWWQCLSHTSAEHVFSFHPFFRLVTVILLTLKRLGSISGIKYNITMWLSRPEPDCTQNKTLTWGKVNNVLSDQGRYTRRQSPQAKLFKLAGRTSVKRTKWS